MEKIEFKMKEIERCLMDLANSGIYPDINMDELKEMLDTPEEFDIKPSELVDNYMFDIDNIKDDIVRLYNLLDKLQDLLYDKDL